MSEALCGHGYVDTTCPVCQVESRDFQAAFKKANAAVSVREAEIEELNARLRECQSELQLARATPPPTREPIRLTDEADALTAAEVWHQWVLDEEPGLPPEWWDITRRAVAAGFRAASLAGGPTLADARTPESEDTE